MVNLVSAIVVGKNGFFDGTLHPKGATVTVDLDALGIASLDDSDSLDPAQEVAASAPAPFDADAFITGNVQDILPRLAALSEEHLVKVKEAEIDREAPRKGLLSAIEQAINSRA